MQLPVLDPTPIIPTTTDVLPGATASAAEASAAPGNRPPLADSFGRGVEYLRLSLTKACAMRCLYCRPETVDNPRGELRLDPAEIERLVEHMAGRHGVTKVRLTGGDPTSRADLTEIIDRIAAVDGVEDLAMTTNGLTLERRAGEYAVAGLNRINVSLDTLDPDRFTELTGVDGMDRVLRGIEAARREGLKVKLNTVVVRDQNEADLPQLLRFAAQRRLEVRFIELMPMGPLAERWEERYVSQHRMRRRLSEEVLAWQPLPQGAAAARRFRVLLRDGRPATVGFITPMSCNFCASCNRVRIAADGTLYPCLMDEPSGSILPALRPRFDPDRLDAILADGLAGKRREHPHDGHAIMTHIGG